MTSTHGEKKWGSDSCVMPPDASTSKCGNCCLSAAAEVLRSGGAMLSNITMSAPAAAASTPSSSVRASTSILLLNPAARLACCTAAVMLPALHTWLSFNMTMLERSRRWVAAPPTSKAYFSTTLNPGVVLRVPAKCPCHPCAFATATALAASVATPEALLNVLSAVLSPRSKKRAGPRTMATTTFPPFALDAATWSPSAARHSTVHPKCSNTNSKKGEPASTPSLLPNRYASSSFSPTTRPPMSKLGQSSRTQPSTSFLQCTGSRLAKSCLLLIVFLVLMFG
mmetsp:Transcript_38876/g.76626  ORF Transcript_38876/g.76626 Transcript_38876/m.76626 type:complete len:282 (+) Transcript_38876:2036-2881(+)